MELPGEDRGGDPSPQPGMREREREDMPYVYYKDMPYVYYKVLI